MLTADERLRYSRHLVLPEVGEAGQEKLKQSSVLIVGLGGLGSPLALYLAAAGVGRLGLVEFDDVSRSNLQRQILYRDQDVGRSKIAIAAESLPDLNPQVKVDVHSVRVSAGEIADLVADYDLVADGSDNFATRYLVNDACVAAGKADVWGAVHRFEGQVAVWGLADGPCYRCLFPDPPPAGLVDNCADAGVLGVVPGVIGSLQGAEVLKLLLGVGESLSGRLLVFDALRGSMREVVVPKDANCPTCSRPGEVVLQDLDPACDIEAETIDGTSSVQIYPQELAELMDRQASFRLLDVRSAPEQSFTGLAGALSIPLEELPANLDQLDHDGDWIVYCHLGIRSAQAVDYLSRQGFARVRNLVGGLDAWSLEVDPTVPRY